MRSLDPPIPEHVRVVLDTSVLIAYLTAEESISDVSRRIIDEFVAGGRNDAVVSTLSAGELLVRPVLDGSARTVAFELMDLPGVQLRSVDLLVAAEAARIRAATSLTVPDAIVIATGVLTGAGCLVTNDRRLAAAVPLVVPEMAVCVLADLVQE